MMEGWEVVPVEGIEVLYRHGGWYIEATWPTKGGRNEVVTLMKVEWRGPDPKLVMSTKRINILSSSAVNSVATTMRKAVADIDQPEAEHLLHQVCEDLMGWYKQGGRVSRPHPAKLPENPGWMVYPIWPAAGATAIVAAPGSYKSFAAQAVALSLATGTEVLARNTRIRQEVDTLYLDWESDEHTFTERLAALCQGVDLPLEPYLGYKKMTARLADVAQATADEVRRGGYGAVIIDSMSASIGGGMVDDDTVNAFWDAVRLLDVPALVIAHKSAENISKRKARFFGSVMSEARVRMAWNVEKAEQSEHILWECFKDNNTGQMRKRLAWEVDFLSEGSGEDRQLGAVTFTGVKPHDVLLTEQDVDGATVATSIVELLDAEGPLSANQIAAKLRKSSSNVRAQLSRHGDKFVKDAASDRWRNRHQLPTPQAKV
jgi:hypothetical protein